VPSYFFHPRSVAVRRQNNAVAMSYYGCASLALLPVLFVPVWGLMQLAALDWWLNEMLDVRGDFGQVVAGAGAVALLAWWVTVVRLARRIMPQLKHRAVALAVSLPLLWIGLGFALLVLLPLAVLYVLIVVASLGR